MRLYCCELFSEKSVIPETLRNNCTILFQSMLAMNHRIRRLNRKDNRRYCHHRRSKNNSGQTNHHIHNHTKMKFITLNSFSSCAMTVPERNLQTLKLASGITISIWPWSKFCFTQSNQNWNSNWKSCLYSLGVSECYTNNYFQRINA